MKYILYSFCMFILSMHSMDQDKNNFFLFDHNKYNYLLETKIRTFKSRDIHIMGFMIKKKHYDLLKFLYEKASILNFDINLMKEGNLKYFFEENIHRSILKKYNIEENLENIISKILKIKKCYGDNSLFGLFDEDYASGIIQKYLNHDSSLKHNSSLLYLLLPHYFKSNFTNDTELFKKICVNKLRDFYEKFGYDVIFVDLSNYLPINDPVDLFFSFLKKNIDIGNNIFCINNNIIDNEKFKKNHPELNIHSVLVEELYLKNEKKLLLLYTPLFKVLLYDKYKDISKNIEFFKKQIKRQEEHKGLKKTCMKRINELVFQLVNE